LSGVYFFNEGFGDFVRHIPIFMQRLGPLQLVAGARHFFTRQVDVRFEEAPALQGFSAELAAVDQGLVGSSGSLGWLGSPGVAFWKMRLTLGLIERVVRPDGRPRNPSGEEVRTMRTRINAQNYTAIAASNRAVMLDFGAAWCATCKKMDPIIDTLAREKDGRVLFAKVDIGESPSVAEKLGVLGVPTVVFLRDGQPVHQATFNGPVSKDRLARMMAEYLGV